MRRRYKRPPRRTLPEHNINHNIRASTLRVIDENGKQLGVLTKEEALRKANENELDLVEIAPKAKPPVAKIIDYNKFLYDLKKRRKGNKKASRKSGETKEIWLKPFIAEHDLNARSERGKELLSKSGKLKIVIKFKRRELSRKQFGYDVMTRYIESLGDVAVDSPPKLLGFRLIAVVSKK